jgi:hypothetical protein
MTEQGARRRLRFVVAILAYYTPELALSFTALGIDPFSAFTFALSCEGPSDFGERTSQASSA